MSEHHRALVFLVLLGLAAYRLSQPLQALQHRGAAGLRRNLWLALTLVAFLTGSFWVFFVFAFGVLLWARGRDRNAPALFLALLFVVPPADQPVPGLGLVNFLFDLSLPRLLSLTLLLPVFLRLVQKRGRPGGAFVRAADLLFCGYVAVNLALLTREASLTSALRGAFYLFVDMVLPYWVFSRALDDLADLRDAVGAFVTGGVVLAAVGIFELARHWLLYSALVDAWGSQGKLLYLGRGTTLRAMASTGHAIALGYVLAACLLLYLPLRGDLRGWKKGGLLAMLAAGLLAPLSRGPWLGAAAGLLLYVALGRRPARNLMLLAVVAAGAFAILPFLPSGQFVLGMIPFFGDIETGNLRYRERLIHNAAQLLWEHPLLGLTDYEERLATMGMTQGQGIVDIVNTYVQVGLRSGFLGLGCFAGCLAASLLSVLRARTFSPAPADDLGRGLAAAQVAVIVTIATVSSIAVVPWVYWCLTGMMLSYARLVHAAAADARSVDDRLRFA